MGSARRHFCFAKKRSSCGGQIGILSSGQCPSPEADPRRSTYWTGASAPGQCWSFSKKTWTASNPRMQTCQTTLKLGTTRSGPRALRYHWVWSRRRRGIARGWSWWCGRHTCRLRPSANTYHQPWINHYNRLLERGFWAYAPRIDSVKLLPKTT